MRIATELAQICLFTLPYLRCFFPRSRRLRRRIRRPLRLPRQLPYRAPTFIKSGARLATIRKVHARLRGTHCRNFPPREFSGRWILD